MNKTSKLINDEVSLHGNNTKRASALFPFWVHNESNTIIVFQNYWKWKREADVKLNIRICSENGEILFINKNQNIINYHNEISVRKILEDAKTKISIGTIEIEIISFTKNIVFPFPALMAFYTNGKGEYSCVHSAGRTLLKEESLEEENFYETNFNCKLDKNFTPFIHLFTGEHSSLKNILLSIHNLDKGIYEEFKIQNMDKSYHSKIIYLKDIISENLYKKIINTNFFIKIKGRARGIYPRFIVGNYSKTNNMHYCTHSYRQIVSADVIEPSKKLSYTSSICLPSLPNAKLRWKIYPTLGNENPLKIFKKNSVKFKESLYEADASQIIFFDNKKESSNIVETGLVNEGNVTAIFTDSGGRVPARVNCALEYFNQDSHHSTDIAHQLITVKARKRINFWGHFLKKSGYKSYLLISNVLPNQNNEDCELEIQKFADNLSIIGMKKFNIKAGTSLCIDLNKECKFLFEEQNEDKFEFISWRGKVKVGQIQDIYQVSLNDESGNILGDHSF